MVYRRFYKARMWALRILLTAISAIAWLGGATVIAIGLVSVLLPMLVAYCAGMLVTSGDATTGLLAQAVSICLSVVVAAGICVMFRFAYRKTAALRKRAWERYDTSESPIKKDKSADTPLTKEGRRMRRLAVVGCLACASICVVIWLCTRGSDNDANIEQSDAQVAQDEDSVSGDATAISYPAVDRASLRSRQECPEGVKDAELSDVKSGMDSIMGEVSDANDYTVQVKLAFDGTDEASRGELLRYVAADLGTSSVTGMVTDASGLSGDVNGVWYDMHFSQNSKDRLIHAWMPDYEKQGTYSNMYVDNANYVMYVQDGLSHYLAARFEGSEENPVDVSLHTTFTGMLTETFSVNGGDTKAYVGDDFLQYSVSADGVKKTATIFGSDGTYEATVEYVLENGMKPSSFSMTMDLDLHEPNIALPDEDSVTFQSAG